MADAWHHMVPRSDVWLCHMATGQTKANGGRMKSQKEYTIDFDTSGGSSVLGRLIRLLMFPIVWVMTGKAKL